LQERQQAQSFGWTCWMTMESTAVIFCIEVPFTPTTQKSGVWGYGPPHTARKFKPTTNVGSLWWTHKRFNTAFWNLHFYAWDFNFSWRWRLGSSTRLYGVTSQNTVISL
jgi:hypothetical protein